MSDIEDLKQLVAAAASAAENANAAAERSFRLADDNQHSILVLNQQMVHMQQQMLQMQTDMRGMQVDMRPCKLICAPCKPKYWT